MALAGVAAAIEDDDDGESREDDDSRDDDDSDSREDDDSRDDDSRDDDSGDDDSGDDDSGDDDSRDDDSRDDDSRDDDDSGPVQVACERSFIGPKRYTRTTGRTELAEEFERPVGLIPPFALELINGEANGDDRVTSARIVLNGAEVAVPSDFQNRVAGFTREITLADRNRLDIELHGSPGTFFTLTLCGRIKDETPPALAIVAPVRGAHLGTPRPAIDLGYPDEPGADEIEASGSDPATLLVTLDGADITSALSAGPVSAQGQVPSDLAEGLHELTAEVSDVRGNRSEAVSGFLVDLTPPSIDILAPGVEDRLPGFVTTLRVSYGDAGGLSPGTLRIVLNDVDVTWRFAVGETQAVAQTDRTWPLLEGENVLVAGIADLAGNASETEPRLFRVDVEPPLLRLDSPEPGAFVATSSPHVRIAFSDDQGLDRTSFAATVGGQDVTGLFTVAADSATATLEPSADGLIEVDAEIRDLAGNLGTLSGSFTIDTTAPAAGVARPADGAFTDDATPELRIEYGDGAGSGVQAAAVKLFLRPAQPPAGQETELTAFLTIADGVGVGELPEALSLADGGYLLRVEAEDRAGNPVSVESGFTVDTVAPTYEVTKPGNGAFVATATPSIAISYADDVSGVDPELLQFSIDGLNLSQRLIAGPEQATGTLLPEEALAEGEHSVAVTVLDRAGNASQPVPHAFTVDTIDPTIRVELPADGDYTSEDVVDVEGTVMDASPIASVTVDGVQATVEADGRWRASGVPVTPGADDTARLAAVATDLAGNQTTLVLTLRVDRDPPVVTITSPVAGAFLRGPMLEVRGTVVDDSPVMVDVNGEAAAVSGSDFTATVAVIDGSAELVATAVDAATNTGTDTVTVRIDSRAPVITVTTPQDGDLTNRTSVTVAGQVSDDSAPLVLSVNGQPVPLDGDGRYSVDVPLPGEGSNPVLLRAVDPAQNESTRTLTVTRDTIAPELGIDAPEENDLLGALPISLLGSVSDATSGVTVTVEGVAAEIIGDAWTAAITSLAEGKRTLTATAVDDATNASQASVRVTLDLAAPIVTITAPLDGTLTREDSVLVEGTVLDVTLESVVVAGVAAVISGSGPFTFAVTVPLPAFENHLVAVATDALSRTGSTEVAVTSDTQPPVITLTAPDTISRRAEDVEASAVVIDDDQVAAVTFYVDGVEVAVFDAEPYRIPLSVPGGKSAGDTIAVRVVARDRAGNEAEVSAGVTVAADGVVVGRVLADETGLPLAGVTVRLGAEDPVATDERGRYSIPTGDAIAVVSVEPPGATTVERRAGVESGVGTVPVDARPTQLDVPVAIGADGGQLSSEGLRSVRSKGDEEPERTLIVTVPPGAVAAATAFRLTALSGQGLPGLLPLGFAPAAAFDLRSEVSPTLPLSAAFSALPGRPLHLAEYRYTTHAWHLVAPDLMPAAGGLIVELPSPGVYALVAADAAEPPVELPAVGEALEGVDMVELPGDVTGTGTVIPPVIPSTGGTARGELTIAPATPVPSGTVLRADVTETFSLADGGEASEERRLQDVVIYRPLADPLVETTLAAELPIAPSRTFQATELLEGTVSLDILPGRESVRGRLGGSSPVTVESGEFTVTVAGGSLAGDTAISVTPMAQLSSFLPSSGGIVPLGEAVLDFSGQTLALAAELSFGFAAVQPDDTLLIAKVVRVDGVPQLEVVSLAELRAGRLVSKPSPDLPGIREDGRYVFFRAPPIGFVEGSTTSGGGAVRAVLGTVALPFIAVADVAGRYTLVSSPGLVTVSAFVPATSLIGAGNADVVVAETTPLDIALAGAVTTATVDPANGAVAVSPTRPLEILASAPLDPTSVGGETVKLFEAPASDGAGVPLRFVLSGSARTLSVIPVQALEFGTEYTLQAAGLRDVFGGVVTVPPTTFRVRDDVTPVYDLDALQFSFPDENGIVTVGAPAGTFPPGTRVLLVNAGNGIVLSLTVGNDGAVTGELPASISHQILVTVTDPFGNVTSLAKSQFFDPTTGRTAIGPGGGTVAGPGGVELRIPEGALQAGAVLEIRLFDSDEFPENERPDLPGAIFGAGLQVESADMPDFAKPVELAFPKPADAPPGAFYYVYRRLVGPEGRVAFETIDQAAVEGEGGDARVVTASPPFSSYHSSAGTFAFAGALGPVATNHLFMVWTQPTGPEPRAETAVITGKVLRTLRRSGASAPDFEPLAGALVSGTDAAGVPLYEKNVNSTVAVSQEDGTFALYDPHFSGGTFGLVARFEGEEVTATAVATDPSSLFHPALRVYEAVATANLAFPPEEPPAPAAELVIRVTRLVEGRRRPIDGLAVEGTPLIIGFSAEHAEVVSARINGVEFSLRIDPLRGQPLGSDVILDGAAGGGAFLPAGPGALTVVATARRPGGSVFTATSTVRVIAGGGVIDALPEEPPRLIRDRTVPRDGSVGVRTTAAPELHFTEPVTGVAGAVILRDERTGEPVTVAILGATADGEIVNLSAGPDVPVVSVILEPESALEYAARYALVVGPQVRDLDDPPKGVDCPNDGCVSFFTTFAPEAIGQSGDTFDSAGIAALQDRAYLVDLDASAIRAFDLTDPSSPEPIPSALATTFGRFSQDLAGDVDDGGVLGGNGGRVLALLNRIAFFGPQNLLLYDASRDEETRLVGAVSLSRNLQEDGATRVVVKAPFAYVVAVKRGIQIVDMRRAIRNLESAAGDRTDTPEFSEVLRTMTATSGSGFGTDAVVRLIPFTHGAGGFYDVDVLENATGRFVLATGYQTGLLVADPVTGARHFDGPIVSDTFTITHGNHVAAGRVGERDLAVVVGAGGPPTVIGVMDVTDPTSPETLAVAALPGVASATDVVFRGSQVLVGSKNIVTVVDLTAPRGPRIVGSIRGVGGRLAVTRDGAVDLVLSTARVQTGDLAPLGGLRVASFDPFVVVVDAARRRVLPSLRLPRDREIFVRASVPSADPVIPGVRAVILDRTGDVFRSRDGTEQSTEIQLLLDFETQEYLAPLRLADQDCAVEIDELGDEPTQACQRDLESGPWTRLKIELPESHGGLERVVDIRAFRLVALGDSLTQGVQNATVVTADQVDSYPAQVAARINESLKGLYQRQVIFGQALINAPGSPFDPPLGRPRGSGNGRRSNPDRQPPGNLGLSGATIEDLSTVEAGAYPTPCSADGARCGQTEPQAVWPLVLGSEALQIQPVGTAVEAAVSLDPSLILLFAGSNELLGPARECQPHKVLPPEQFEARYQQLVSRLQAETRADIVLATIPNIETIPHLLPIGRRVGDLPWTSPEGPEETTLLLEQVVAVQGDHPEGTKTSITCLLQRHRAEILEFSLSLFPPFYSLRPNEILLPEDDVLDPAELRLLDDAVTSYNQIIRDLADQRDLALVDVNALLRDRVSVVDQPTRLNTLYTGTLRQDPDEYGIRRGLGNTLFSWDGIHPNGAGYSLLANAYLEVINDRLADGRFGGLTIGEDGSKLPLVGQERITELLLFYLNADRNRIVEDITTVR